MRAHPFGVVRVVGHQEAVGIQAVVQTAQPFESGGVGDDQLAIGMPDLCRQFGVAVTTRSLAVGGLVPHGAGRLGAMATQARVNPLWGVDGMRLLAEGRGAREVIEFLTRADAGAHKRQMHVVDAKGDTFAHTVDLTSEPVPESLNQSGTETETVEVVYPVSRLTDSIKDAFRRNVIDSEEPSGEMRGPSESK